MKSEDREFVDFEELPFADRIGAELEQLWFVQGQLSDAARRMKPKERVVQPASLLAYSLVLERALQELESLRSELKTAELS